MDSDYAARATQPKFRSFLDELHQPYNRTKRISNITVNNTNLQDNGEDNLKEHLEQGD
jgi:hypothetical protein